MHGVENRIGERQCIDISTRLGGCQCKSRRATGHDFVESAYSGSNNSSSKALSLDKRTKKCSESDNALKANVVIRRWQRMSTQVFQFLSLVSDAKRRALYESMLDIA